VGIEKYLNYASFGAKSAMGRTSANHLHATGNYNAC